VSLEVSSTVRRSSLGDRERVVRRLRSARVEDRISQDTFARRLELAFAARTQNELDWLLSDLPEPTWVTRALVATVGTVSRWTSQVAAAWRDPRTPRLLLPTHGDQLTMGRSRRCNCVISDPSVSRKHAVLRKLDGTWWLKDAGSSNGTWVNGWRVTDAVEVRAGDEVMLGRTRFVLACRTTQPH